MPEYKYHRSIESFAKALHRTKDPNRFASSHQHYVLMPCDYWHKVTIRVSKDNLITSWGIEGLCLKDDEHKPDCPVPKFEALFAEVERA